MSIAREKAKKTREQNKLVMAGRIEAARQENMTLAEVAAFFRISYKKASKKYLQWEKIGIIAFREGRQILFPREQVLRARNNAALI